MAENDPKDASRRDFLRNTAVTALAGTALIQISSYVTTPAIRSGKLKTVLSGFQVDSPAIWVMYPQNRHLTPRVRAFVDFLVEWAK